MVRDHRGLPRSGRAAHIGALRPSLAEQALHARVVLRVTYGSLDGNVSLTQLITVEPKRVTIQDTVSDAKAIENYLG